MPESDTRFILVVGCVRAGDVDQKEPCATGLCSDYPLVGMPEFRRWIYFSPAMEDQRGSGAGRASSSPQEARDCIATPSTGSGGQPGASGQGSMTLIRGTATSPACVGYFAGADARGTRVDLVFGWRTSRQGGWTACLSRRP